MYQREIIYMDLLENGIRTGCAGYLKLERRQEKYNIELQLKKLPNLLEGDFPIRLQGKNDWKEAGTLAVKDGSGRWNGSAEEPVFRAEVILTKPYGVRGISKNAPAGSGRELSGIETKEERNEGIINNDSYNNVRYNNADNSTSNNSSSNNNTSNNNASNNNASNNKTNNNNTNNNNASNNNTSNNNISNNNISSNNMNDNISNNSAKNDNSRYSNTDNNINSNSYDNATNNNNSGSATADKTEYGMEISKAELHESKWEQLLSTYEKIHPYGDNRVYIKLEPKDFVILRENYQHLVNNSFLLHGFYNYRYVILGKEKDFYLGVPGVFYEREKMVALMFGFEAFECEGGEAEEGKFGYYLRKVEI